MSLLLLFPGPGSTGFQWTVVAGAETDWTVSHHDFANVWSEWESSTWSAIESSSRTWNYLAGDTFTVVTDPVTTWSVSTLPTED